MSIKSISVSVTAVMLACAGLAAEAGASPYCGKGGARYSAAKSIPSQRQALASKPAPKAAVAALAQAPAAEKKVEEKVAAAKVERPAPLETAGNTVDSSSDYPSVTAVAARLAALSAQAAANANANGGAGE